MANKTVHLPMAQLEGTLRNDAWWVGPAATAAVLSGFIVYATWRAFEGAAYEWQAVSVALLFAVLRRLVGQARGPRLLLSGDAHPARARRASASPVTTTGRPTTARSHGTRRRAPSASARRTGTTARRSSSSSRTCTGTRCTSRSSSSSSSGKTRSPPWSSWPDGLHVGVGHAGDAGERRPSHAGTPSAATASATSSAAASNSYSTAPLGSCATPLEGRDGAQRAAHAVRLGEPLLRRPDRSLHPLGRDGPSHGRAPLLVASRSPLEPHAAASSRIQRNARE